MLTHAVEEGRILIVDDEPGNVATLTRVLRGSGFKHIESTTDSRLATDLYQSFQPDLILLDLKMPHMTGFDVMTALTDLQTRGNYLPILVLTAQRDHATRLQALASGAKDFLNKPIDMAEAVTRIRNMLEVRLLHNAIISKNKTLEELVQERTIALEHTRLEIIHRLGRAAEYRDNETSMHVIRMSQLCYRLAQEIGLGEDQCQLILNASPLHDVGKIGVPDHILLKPGKLNEEEWDAMRKHPEIGAEILSGSHSPIMQEAERIALTHQERWDGSGYPRGLKGEEIPLSGRIVALCDVFDALTSKRHYKEAFSTEKAMEIIKSKSGIDFDPRLVEAFEKILPDMLAITESFTDEEHHNTLKIFRQVAQAIN